MTDTATPPKCCACGAPLPEGKGKTMKIVNPRIQFVGWFCHRAKCQDAGFAKAYEDRESRRQ